MSKPLTDMQLIERHPIKITHPWLTGEHFLLSWWTDSERHNLVLSRTLEGLTGMFAHVAEKHYLAKPVACWKIDVVSPSLDNQVRAAKAYEKAEKQSMEAMVVSDMAVLRKVGLVPDMNWIEACPGFEPACDCGALLGGEPCVCVEPSEWTKKGHYDCKHCKGGYVFDIDEVYEELRPRYLATRVGVRSGFVKPGDFPVPLKAPLAVPTEDLFLVVDDHGHHREGSVLSLVKDEDFDFIQEGKFFCHAEKLEIPAGVKQIHDAAEAKHETKQLKYKIESQASAKKDDERRLSIAKQFFGI